MAPDTRQENQLILSYVSSPTIIKTAKIKDAAEINKNNNNNYETKTVLRQYFSNRNGVLAQCLVTGSILILTAGAGMPIGYSAVLLPQLAENNGTLHADKELGSWIASVHSLVSPLGSLLSGPLLDVIGRRGCLQLSSIPLCIGFAVIGMAKSIPCILAGRVIAGFAVGLVAVPAQVLIGEMADPGLRGLLVGTPFAAYSMGILFVYILGATFSWETVAFCGTALPLLALLTLSLVPESPAWLVKRRRIGAAKKALLWLRGGDIVQVNTEIALLEARAKADVARMSSTVSLSQQATLAISNILNPGVLKPLAIINIFNFLQILSGTYVIVFYGVNIISEIGGDTMDKYLAAVVTAAIRSLFCLLCCILLLKVGRRALGIVSSIGTAVTCLILAGYMLAKKENSIVDAYVIGFCLLMYVAANTIGLMSLPGVMLGELLPLRARGFGGGTTFFIFNLLIFSVTKLFPLITERVGMTGVFTIFGASALLESVFVYVALPETKGRSLQQIEDYFQQGNVLWVTRTKEPKSNDGLTIVNV